MHCTEQIPRMALVLSSLFQLNSFMKPHLCELSKTYAITLFVRDNMPEIWQDLALPNGVQLQKIPIRRNISLFWDFITLLHLLWHFSREKYDIVWSVTPKAGLLGQLAGFFARCRVRVHIFQGEVWATATGFKRWLLRGLDRLVARSATHVIVVSRSERDFLRNERVLHTDQGILLGAGSICGVNLNRFQADINNRRKQRSELGYTTTDIVFAYLGRISPDKGVDLLIKAFEDIDPNGPAKLLLVGPDEGGIKQDALSHFGHRAQVKPFTHAPEKILSAVDVLVLPSRREGFGLVLLEAAAMGLPTIATNIYGITDAVIDGKTGLLFEKDDVSDLKDQMIKLIENQDLRMHLGKAGRDRVVHAFDENKIIDHYVEFFNSLEVVKHG